MVGFLLRVLFLGLQIATFLQSADMVLRGGEGALRSLGLSLRERQHRHEDPTLVTSPKPVYLSKASPPQVRASTYK